MEDLTRSLREIRGGAVARLLLADVLQLAEREGILEWMRKRSPFTWEELCGDLRSELGFALHEGNRGRMIRLLLLLLGECRWIRETGGGWQWATPDPPALLESGDGAFPAGEPARADAQYRFFRGCLDSIPTYLRGGRPAVLFGEQNVLDWERFLGCAEFRTCRSLLLELMGIKNRPSFRLLDLCHGPGWGLEAAIARFPAVRITAMDFTEAFCRTVRDHAERAQALQRQAGNDVPAVVWVGPERWKGFGHPLPFPEAAFEAVFFAGGDPYIPRGLRGEVYEEIGRILVPGGTLGVLTRSCPDSGARHVRSHWLRIAALAHDFTESVCEGWEGFSDAEEKVRVFSEAGFEGGVALSGAMSLLDSCLWIVRRRRPDA
jgi:SAM-dependent methyltransferase